MDSAARRYLATMPLHAITEIYGEEGLRERFAIEAARLADERIADALVLAGHLHRDDRRVREPYVNHLLRVATRLLHHYRVDDPDVIVAGVLHDTVEDHPHELAAVPAEVPVAQAREEAFGVLAARFGARVADLVRAVTNPIYDEDTDKHEQYRALVAHALADNPWARVIKASDFTDNGVGVIHTTGPKLAKAAAKYRLVLPVLRELVARPDTPLHPEVKERIAAQFDLAESRFAAILGC
jgi:(p)ppGpp synthase/HD superfamily hydrolase